MGDTTYLFPVALTWDQGPESLRKLKTKLLLYFGKKNESDGGECEIPNTNCDQGHVLIYFKEETVRNRVLQKSSHQMKLPGGKLMKLEVRAAGEEGRDTPKPTQDSVAQDTPQRPVAGTQKELTPPVTPNPPTSSSLVLIENVQDNHNLEVLGMLVGNLSKKDENDFFVEMIPEIQAAAVSFSGGIDISSFIQNLAISPRAKKLTAKPLEESRTIRVEGLPPSASEDLLLLYFEKPSHGGPDSVESATIIPEEAAALVTFSNVQSVKKVLAMKHELSKKPLSVYPYYPSLDTVLYGKQSPHIEKPEPLTFPVSPYILEFILKNAQVKDNMEKTMRDHKCEISWPDVSRPSPVITLYFPDAMSSHLRTMAKLAPTWKQKVNEQFSLLMSHYTAREHSMKQRAWEAIRDHVGSPAYSGVLITPDFAREKVFLAGMCKDVTKIDPTFRKLIEETNEKVERGLCGVTENVPMSRVFYQIMCNSGLQKKILEKVPKLEMDYDESSKKVHLRGLNDEVLTAKCDILCLMQQMESKTIQVNPYLTQFLMSTDNDELSSLLFVRNKINALLGFDGNTPKLTASSNKDLTEAEEQIKQELDCRHITVEEKSLLKSPKWRNLNSHLMESFNMENTTVLVLVCPPGADNDVVTAGLSASVHKCHQQVSDFMEKNTPMERNIKVKSPAVMQFLREEKKQLWNDLKNVTVDIRNKVINVSGGKLHITNATAAIEGVLSSLFSDTLTIDKPGAKKFWLTEEAMYEMMAKKTHGCVICLQKEEDQDDDDVDKAQVKLPNGVMISAHKGDLCRFNVDVVVNAANKDLKHDEGLALALRTAAGPKLQEESDQIVKQEGPLSAGEAVMTDSGKLPCKQVIHAVGPQWKPRSEKQCEQILREAITMSMELAEGGGHSSIAFPAIGAGSCGFPVDKCAENIVQAIKQFVESKSGGLPTIKEVHLVDTREDTVRAFASALNREFGQEEADLVDTREDTVRAFASALNREFGQEEADLAPDDGMGGADTAGTAPNIPAVQLSGNQMTTKENIIITIHDGLIQEAKTDVVVNSVGRDLDLDSGGASRALSAQAGNKLQQCLKKASSGARVQDGSVFVTEGCNLACCFVIHVVTPEWDNGKGSSEKIDVHPSVALRPNCTQQNNTLSEELFDLGLRITSEQIFRQIVSACLSKTEEKQATSITFPAIGTGILGFPKSLVASMMFDEVLKFSNKNAKHIKEVNFILHPNDRETMAEFCQEMKKLDRNAGSNPASQASAGANAGARGSAGAVRFGWVKTPAPGSHEITMGSLLYQVTTGDITKETTDVIVNSTDQTFTRKSGVSKAILEAAGASVESECARLGSQGKKRYIVTDSGNLSCKNILHVFITNSAADIKESITEALTECGHLQASSVAFPAIGTGQASLSSALVADTILKAVAKFARSPQSVQTVKVVVFKQEMLDVFLASMKKKEGTALPQKSKSLHSKMKSAAGAFKCLFTRSLRDFGKSDVFELRDNIEPAIFHLCAESQQALSKATSWLQELLIKDLQENVITDDWIQEFSTSDQDTLIELQKKHNISLTVDLSSFTITVSGLSKDVLEVSNTLRGMLKGVREKKAREREAELCSHVVEWKYDKGTGFVPFDKMTNMELEKAKTEGRQSLNISVNGVQYSVIVERDSARDPKGNVMQIQRNIKNEQLGLPKGWEPMTNINVLVVALNSGSQEYKDVEAQFQKTCQNRIIKIERIQNRHLWLSYQVKKQNIDAKNGSMDNEKQLFHGCELNAIKSVNQYGFNRSYAGKNAAYYGNGTYFAVNASYSADDTYSRPDAKGYKYMYLSRVITGKVGIGKQGMRVPPPKDPKNPTDLYDSVTNNAARPVMYVIFNDIQAYPEYLITFS